ncbi:MAG: hypothetical protein QOE51_101 [Actinoplanes sp.]|jgi:beta-glucanase (GH16 family)|nr:hypothetical protein [Actinoplanes sp.]
MIDLKEPEPLTRHRRNGRPMGVLIAAAAVLVLLLGGAFVLYRSRSASPVADVAAAAAAPVVSPAGPTASPAGPVPSVKQATSKPLAAAKPAVPKAAAGVPAPPAGFTLTFADAFGGAAGTGLNRQIFSYDTGPGSTFGTGEIETMTDSAGNVFHDGQGHLVLRARHTGSDPGQGWTSGRVETRAATFGAAKGGVVRMQASIQQPNVSTATGAGYWPAFWMLGNGLRAGGTWPRIGEVDILEDVNSRGSVFGTLHCGVNPGGPCNESSGVGSGEHACAGCQSGLHTYAVEIDRSRSVEQIRWYLDGRAYFTLSQSRFDAKTWADAVDHPFFIIFDLAIGGGFPGAFGGGPNARTVSGGSMKIDYVAVYNKG